MARENAGPNVLLTIRDHLPELLDELHRERDKMIAKLLDLNQRIALAETLRQVAPQDGNGPEAAP